MNIYDLDVLVRDREGIYNFDKLTHNYGVNTIRYEYVVQISDEMRIDVICNNIYGDVDNVGFLLNYNNIDNPLNIKAGDIIYYVKNQDIELFKNTIDSVLDINDVPSSNRSSRTDKNRESLDRLPPTVLRNSSPSVQVDGNFVRVGGDRNV